MSFSIFEAVQVRIAGEKRRREPQLADLLGSDTVHWYINTGTIGFSAKYGAKKWSRPLTDGSRKKFSFVWPQSMKVSYFVYVFAFLFFCLLGQRLILSWDRRRSLLHSFIFSFVMKSVKLQHQSVACFDTSSAALFQLLISLLAPRQTRVFSNSRLCAG